MREPSVLLVACSHRRWAPSSYSGPSPIELQMILLLLALLGLHSMQDALIPKEEVKGQDCDVAASPVVLGHPSACSLLLRGACLEHVGSNAVRPVGGALIAVLTPQAALLGTLISQSQSAALAAHPLSIPLIQHLPHSVLCDNSKFELLDLVMQV